MHSLHAPVKETTPKPALPAAQSPNPLDHQRERTMLAFVRSKKPTFAVVTNLVLLLLVVRSKSQPLLGDTLLSPLAGGLGLCTLGVHLLLDNSLTGGLSLGLVNLRLLSDGQS